MSQMWQRSQGVMEGDGSYNRHAKLPSDGAAMALPSLEKAIKDVQLDPVEGPVVIADYGSSQGKNSLSPMQLAVKRLRSRIGPDRAISVFHIDQPANDFNSLFEVLQSDPNRYSADEANVYPAAIGRSFYDKVLPPNSVHLGWSSYAAMWLSRIPALIPDHFIAICSGSIVRAAFDRQAAEDWETFLSLRARELRPGGRLVVVVPTIADDGQVTIEPLFDHVNAVLEEMVDDSTLASGERSRMTIGVHPIGKRDRLGPFERNREFRHLTIEDFQTSEVSDTAWEQFELDRDAEALAGRRALFHPLGLCAITSVWVESSTCSKWRCRRHIRRPIGTPAEASPFEPTSRDAHPCADYRSGQKEVVVDGRHPDIFRHTANTNQWPRGVALRDNPFPRRIRHCSSWLCNSVTG
jgi:hypothetical protein